MENKYEYLFPFEKIPQGTKILIYGAGDVGQEYLQQMMMTGYCEVVGFIDRNWDKYAKMIVPIYPVVQIPEVSYDYIVIAMKTFVYIKNVMQGLYDLHVKAEQIILPIKRIENDLIFMGTESKVDNGEIYSFNRTRYSIALKYGPGLGDCIQRRIFLNALIRLMPDCQVDIYAPNGDNIRSLYADVSNVKNVFDDAGALYFSKCKRYMLAVEVFFLLKIDECNVNDVDGIDDDLKHTLQILKRNCDEYDLAAFPVTRSRIHLERTIYMGGDCYSVYNYTGIMRPEDRKVQIPLSEKYRESFGKLDLGSYITIHTGSGLAVRGKENVDARQWPQGYYQEFVDLFKKKYPDIAIVQIGDKNTKKLQNVDCYIFDESLEVIKYVLKNAIFHLSTEGGLMHLATQLGTKCVTIFGPTQVELFGYKQNVNLVSQKCSSCYCLYDASFCCARGMEKPECMYDIRVDFVMERIGEFMKNYL